MPEEAKSGQLTMKVRADYLERLHAPECTVSDVHIMTVELLLDIRDLAFQSAIASGGIRPANSSILIPR